MAIFDTHAHLLDEAFDADREAVIARLGAQGITFVEAGTDLEVSRKAAQFTRQYPFMYAAAGIHPHSASQAPGGYLQGLKELLSQEKVVAVGEIGLDYHYDFSPREVQRRVFEEQLALSAQVKKPVVVHMREATEDTLCILKANRPYGGVMHCFSGSAETVRECLKLGFYISFSGSVTFKNAVHVREAAAAVPLDRLLAETDCPYMSPEPFRGKRNDPEKVKLVMERLAQIKNIGCDEMYALNEENAKKLFVIK